MKKLFLSLFAVPAFALAAMAQDSPQQPAQPPSAQAAPNHFPSGVTLPAELSKSIDSKKAKQGDKVEAKLATDLLSNGKVVVPRDSKLYGHITDAKAHSKESPDAKVTIAFDRIAIKNGQEMPLQASIQAIARPLNYNNVAGSPMSESGGMPQSSPPSAPNGSGGMSGPSSNPYPTGSRPSAPADSTAGNTANTNSNSNVALEAQSQGVVGMKGVSLSSSGQDSVISSNDENVHLDSGTQMILKTQ
jgi:hypothetical protein